MWISGFCFDPLSFQLFLFVFWEIFVQSMLNEAPLSQNHGILWFFGDLLGTLSWVYHDFLALDVIKKLTAFMMMFLVGLFVLNVKTKQ